MEWIEHNTSTEAQFLINHMEWFPFLYAGSDGGFRITPLTKRRTTLPPVLFGMGDPDDVRAIQDLARRVQANATEPAALRRLIQEAGADYVYIGARGGRLVADVFLESKDFELVYSNDRVLIFHVLPTSGQGDLYQRMTTGR